MASRNRRGESHSINWDAIEILLKDNLMLISILNPVKNLHWNRWWNSIKLAEANGQFLDVQLMLLNIWVHRTFSRVFVQLSIGIWPISWTSQLTSAASYSISNFKNPVLLS